MSERPWWKRRQHRLQATTLVVEVTAVTRAAEEAVVGEKDVVAEEEGVVVLVEEGVEEVEDVVEEMKGRNPTPTTMRMFPIQQPVRQR